MKTNSPKTDTELWSLLNHLLKERALSLTIKNGNATVVMKLKGNELITEIYENGTLRKVNHHLANSAAEIIQALNEFGICLWSMISKLAVLKFWRRKTLYLEYHPEQSDS